MSTKIMGKFVLRKKAVLPLKVKIEILDRLRHGESLISVARDFNVNESTVRSIKKSEDKIRNSKALNSSAKMVRDPAVEKMENALMLWIEDCNRKNMPLSGPVIRKKAKLLYTQFKGFNEHTPGGFRASEGWFSKFKMRQALHYHELTAEQDGFEHINIPESQVTQDEDFKQTDIEQLLHPHSIKGDTPTTYKQATLNLKNLRKGLQMANELGDFFIKMDPSMERSNLFKRLIVKATAEYQSELKDLLKKTKQENN